MNKLETHLATLAHDKIKDAGGKVSFDQYDLIMHKESYFAPINWITGWGLPRSVKKSNDDKLCVFAAIKLGLVTQSPGFYEVAL